MVEDAKNFLSYVESDNRGKEASKSVSLRTMRSTRQDLKRLFNQNKGNKVFEILYSSISMALSGFKESDNDDVARTRIINVRALTGYDDKTIGDHRDLCLGLSIVFILSGLSVNKGEGRYDHSLFVKLLGLISSSSWLCGGERFVDINQAIHKASEVYKEFCDRKKNTLNSTDRSLYYHYFHNEKSDAFLLLELRAFTEVVVANHFASKIEVFLKGDNNFNFKPRLAPYDFIQKSALFTPMYMESKIEKESSLSESSWKPSLTGTQLKIYHVDEKGFKSLFRGIVENIGYYLLQSDKHTISLKVENCDLIVFDSSSPESFHVFRKDDLAGLYSCIRTSLSSLDVDKILFGIIYVDINHDAGRKRCVKMERYFASKEKNIMTKSSSDQCRTMLTDILLAFSFPIRADKLAAEGLIDSKTRNGYHALFEAVRGNDSSAVKNLITEGADVNLKTDYSEMTALLCSIDYGFFDITKILLDCGADPDNDGSIMRLLNLIEWKDYENHPVTDEYNQCVCQLLELLLSYEPLMTTSVKESISIIKNDKSREEVVKLLNLHTELHHEFLSAIEKAIRSGDCSLVKTLLEEKYSRSFSAGFLDKKEFRCFPEKASLNSTQPRDLRIIRNRAMAKLADGSSLLCIAQRHENVDIQKLLQKAISSARFAFKEGSTLALAYGDENIRFQSITYLEPKSVHTKRSFDVSARAKGSTDTDMDELD
ncbi:ankyrin repeat domain-containing protein [Endozoicomonas ascidiicola]|uniref:ankyrin repeat domain-containing protein n=1 Tax=Endozoicomonas ascidiicola TaxID=1698521 RepID=UPI0008341FEE|nr:ankyrin repeat domain-containing protein [Endozoicomonas ascidiicola]